jgi:hypothetical protein
MVQASVRVVGVDEALKALRTLDPTVARLVGREFSDIGRDLVAEVQSLAPQKPPVSGWVATSGSRGSRGGAGWPAWAPVQSSFRRRGTTVTVSTNSTPPAIASFAESLGRGQKAKTDAGRKLVEMANDRWAPIVKSGKKEGRVARGAIANKYPEVIANLRKACDKAVDEVNRRMP